MFNRKKIKKMAEVIDNQAVAIRTIQFELHNKPKFEVGDKIGDWQVIERTVEEYGEWTAGCGHHHYQYTCYDTNKKGKGKAIDTFPQASLIDIKEKLKSKKIESIKETEEDKFIGEIFKDLAGRGIRFKDAQEIFAGIIIKLKQLLRDTELKDQQTKKGKG